MSPTPERRPSRLVLRRLDQAAVAAVVLVGLVLLSLHLARQAWFGPGLVEIDRAEPVEIQFAVDVNEADWPELMQLPEIGETLAKRMVATREEQGPYLDHEDLRRVPGIGPKTLERIRPYLQPLPGGADVAGR